MGQTLLPSLRGRDSCPQVPSGNYERPGFQKHVCGHRKKYLDCLREADGRYSVRPKRRQQIF
ncbi:rCG43514 [Rattus norvegicus]|uniref:RCG43514 n=1 Tax=Rattus norvegicus TaxID=10116 RepID=A6JIW6_RAT|nr:rCG43514 [Rattus norvegicus]